MEKNKKSPKNKKSREINVKDIKKKVGREEQPENIEYGFGVRTIANDGTIEIPENGKLVYAKFDTPIIRQTEQESGFNIATLGIGIFVLRNNEMAEETKKYRVYFTFMGTEGMVKIPKDAEVINVSLPDTYLIENPETDKIELANMNRVVFIREVKKQ